MIKVECDFIIVYKVQYQLNIVLFFTHYNKCYNMFDPSMKYKSEKQLNNE